MRAMTILFALAVAAPAAVAQTPAQPSSAGPLRVETVTGGLEHPWGLQFLPDGRMLVTERPGRLRLVGRDGALSAPIAGVPQVWARGQGGLLDVRLDPDFATTRRVALCFSEPRDGGAATAVHVARLSADATRLEGGTTVFRQTPVGRAGQHFGCRLVPDRSGALFVAVGDRGDLRDAAQDPSGHVGKVLRIGWDGSVPRDNPGPAGQRPGWAPEIWSIGHRNVQGAALHPATGALWTIEHGARGGDEINIPQRGLNYGWPVISYGREYSGASIGEGQRKAGMEQPAHYWDPSIAPAGAAFITADRIRGWRGSLIVGALVGRSIVRLSLDGDRIVGEERLLTGLGKRIRDVREGPDGALYLLVDAGSGEILRVSPAN